jgi:transcription elongation factor GreA
VSELATPNDLSLSELLSRFVALQKDGKKPVEGYQDLSRFVAWCGRDQKVQALSPAEVADYAQYIGAGGADSAKRLGPVRTFLTFLKKEGWTETGLAPHLRVPRGRRSTNRQAASPAAGSTHLSQDGYDKLYAQLELLKEERQRVVIDIKQAMADKDFRENAPLEAAKERQGFIESKIRELEHGLASAQLLTINEAERQQRVKVGLTVTLKDAGTGREVVYTLVDIREANVASGKISTASPVGQALLDRSVGDEVVINVPKGTLRYTIQKIAT